MKFFHLADVHLGAVPDKGHPWSKQRSREIWATFRRVLEQAAREEIDLILIAGDLFHGQPLLRELKEVNEMFGQLAPAKVVLIAGNHDYIGIHSLYHDFQWNSNVCLMAGEECARVIIRRLNAEIYGLSYHQREILSPVYNQVEADDNDRFKILLAHGGDSKHIPIDWKALEKSGFDYIALGHIHKPQSMYRENIRYAGALEPIDCNDIGPHGYMVGQWEDGKLRLKFRNIACREYHHLYLESDSSMTDASMRKWIRKEILENGPDHLYKVVIHGQRDPQIEYSCEEYMEYGNLLSVEDQSEPEYDYEQLKEENASNIIGRYIERMEKEEGDLGEQALFYGVKALLDSKKEI